jgi:CheY-like chemotaxis protein
MRILVIEDEQKIANLVVQFLTEEGHHVLVAHSGREGLELARTPGLDIVVLDLMLPDIDGLAITKRLRGEGNRVPILMLTARDADEDVVRGLNAGADDYLTKPFLPNFREYDFLMHWLGKPGTSLEAMNRTTIQASRELRAIPGVRNFGSHAGRAEVADGFRRVLDQHGSIGGLRHDGCSHSAGCRGLSGRLSRCADVPEGTY